MVKGKEKFIYLPDGTLDITAWLEGVRNKYHLREASQLNQACMLAQQLGQGRTTSYGQSCLEQSLLIAEVLLLLKLDQETAAAGIFSGAMNFYADETILRKTLGDQITKLINGVKKTELVTSLQKQKTGNQIQADKIRKMLLAMATDIRVVMIKLAERLTFLRGIKSIAAEEQKRYAQEIFDIYAPLASRLGIGQIKWELEDLAFRYQQPETYKSIANFLAERRTNREIRIHQLINELQEKLKSAKIPAEVTGRAKHIYSIYLKMQRKDLDQQEIYDHSAIRILVPTIEDCYRALSIVNSVWSPLLNEFDDYIANPKPNGYRSIHTAVIGNDGKHFEIQIRTYTMHEEAERGVAAHWIYKERKHSPLDDRTKITYLRQLIGWHQEIAKTHPSFDLNLSIFKDQVYVITPAGDILDLPHGSTPIDFAYHIHSEVGHRCRGAKVNGHIVPLTYILQTGDKVDIHTIAEGTPSRDWLNPSTNYIKTARARSKIIHWFKQQELEQHIIQGREQLDKELSRSGLTKTTSLLELAKMFHLKNEEELFAAIGRGTIRLAQIIHSLQPKMPAKKLPFAVLNDAGAIEKHSSTAVIGASGLLIRYAKCCKPIPGDQITGYITQIGGISVHKKSCKNISNLINPNRFIEINWEQNKVSNFVTELNILADDQEKALSNLTALFVAEKIKLLSFNAVAKKNEKISIQVVLQIQHLDHLQYIKERMLLLPGILSVTRVKR